MTVHLIKLSVGPESLADLVQWQTERLKSQKRKPKPELMHITRQTPKRAEELLAGGSIYWVIKNMIVARQKLLELRPLSIDAIPHCGLVYDKDMITVQMRPRRPFQGWRYLDAVDAPSDRGLYGSTQDMPDDMQRELAALGLL